MKRGKHSIIAACIIILCALICFLAVMRRAKTPYGDLDIRAAILLMYMDLARIELFKPGWSIAQVREQMKSTGILKKKPKAVAGVRDTSFRGPGGELKLRIYRPVRDEVLPVVVYCHGGGWALGGLDAYDRLCRAISLASRSLVVLVDYRLAPEHKFPAAVDDCYASLVWVHANAKAFGGDPSRIVLAGDSAGGTLAAVLAVLARDRRGPRISHQALIYPNTDLTGFTTESQRNFARGYYNTMRNQEIFREMYVPDRSKWSDPRVSPLLAPDLRGLPPALVITAEFDSLRDEGEAYAKRLRASGVQVRVKRFNGLLHGFLGMDRLFPQSAEEAIGLIGAEMKKHLALR